MILQKRRGAWFLLPLVLFCFVSCSRCSLPGQDPDGDGLTVLSYNCQNIFDDVANGTEYPEFVPADDGWNTRLFHTRLMNLAEVIRSSCEGGPDIIALQEIENAHVIDTLAGDYLKGMGYRYRVCVGEPGSAVNTGILSRLPFDTFHAHRLDGIAGSTVRNILEVRVETEAGPLAVFNNHWKSKLGGAEETEPLRIRSAALIGRRVRMLQGDIPGVCTLITGDLNENPDEYLRVDGAYRTALMPADGPLHGPGEAESLYVTGDSSAVGVTDTRVVLFSPWSGTEGGSYMYQSAWEQIDHILLGEGFFDGRGLEYSSFEVVDEPFLFTEGGFPFSWSSRTGRGYSDHLPLLLRLDIR